MSHLVEDMSGPLGRVVGEAMIGHVLALSAGATPLPVYPASPELEALFGPENPILTVSSEVALAQQFAAATMVPVTPELLPLTVHSSALANGFRDAGRRRGGSIAIVGDRFRRG